MLNPKRSRLQHTTLEMCIYFKDWLDAKFDEQGIDLYDESSESEHNDSAGSSTTQWYFLLKGIRPAIIGLIFFMHFNS